MERNEETRGTARAGFTLIEMLIVVVIIGLLAGVVGVNARRRLTKAQIETTRSQIASLKTAIKTFELEVGRLPRTLDELVFEGGESWPGPFLDEEEVPKDSWRNDFRYEHAGKRIKVYSAGLDGEFGTDDDIYK